MAQMMICDEIGWLAPNGDYYPCVSSVYKNHKETAHEIIRDVFGLDPDELPDESSEQPIDFTLGLKGYRSYGFLRIRGWVRVDIRSIEPECGLTFEQLVTLSKMCRIHMRGGINRDLIQEILDRNNTDDCDGGFLSTKVSKLIPPSRGIE